MNNLPGYHPTDVTRKNVSFFDPITNFCKISTRIEERYIRTCNITISELKITGTLPADKLVMHKWSQILFPDTRVWT